MATREEKLKKINDELNKLSDEDLDNVAGGSFFETADDSYFLNSLNGLCDCYDATKIFLSMKDDEGATLSGKIEKAWESVGIKAELYPNLTSHNKYFIDGKEITREEAHQHAMRVVGYTMKDSDWNW